MTYTKIEYATSRMCEGAEFGSPDNQRLWECTQKDCDGVHHYFQVSPWKWTK